MTDLPFFSLSWMYLLLLFPAAILYYFRIGVVGDAIVSITRMTIQLVLVGLYLKYIFELNNPALTIAWVIIMLIVANFSILGKTGLKSRMFFWRTLAGISVSTLLVSGWFIAISIRPDPVYDAQYTVPIIGMILGNCMRGNVLSMERFYKGIKNNENEFMTYLMLGASLSEAIRPYLKDAVKAAINPMIATMATMGIVSLPGMMTGQILGGASPMTAIEYQIGIMISIFAAMTLASIANILLSLPIAFDDFQRLQSDIFK